MKRSCAYDDDDATKHWQHYNHMHGTDQHSAVHATSLWDSSTLFCDSILIVSMYWFSVCMWFYFSDILTENYVCMFFFISVYVQQLPTLSILYLATSMRSYSLFILLFYYMFVLSLSFTRSVSFSIFMNNWICAE